MEQPTDTVASQAIITSLCWVSKGYAKANLDEFEPSKQNLSSHAKISKKLAKGKDLKKKDLAAAAKELEE